MATTLPPVTTTRDRCEAPDAHRPPVSVTGARSPAVTAARRLLRSAERARQGLFLVEGPQAVREVLAERGLVELFATEAGAARHPDLVAAAPRLRVVDDRVLASLCDTVTPQGLVGVAPTRITDLEDVLARRPRLLVGLVGVAEPGNAGAVIRVADAAGADAVVLSAGSVDPYNGKAVRASAGSLFHLPVVTGTAPDTLPTRLRSAGLRVLAAAADADLDLDEAADAGLLNLPTAWLFGNEAGGLDPAVRARADHVVAVPLHGRAESLNVATAAAVCLYASARAQRRAARS